VTSVSYNQYFNRIASYYGSRLLSRRDMVSLSSATILHDYTVRRNVFMCAVIFCDPIAIPVQSNPVEAKAISSLNSLLYDVLPIRSPESPWKALVSSYPRSTKTASYKNFWRGAKAGWWSNDGRNYGLEKNWGWFSVQHKNGQSHLYQSYFRSGFQENIFQRHFPKFVISAGE